ncbi:MAG: hypothetical protein KC466_02595 [Myxococcales bacterium]|nr:hypothetical protein [Myxococcales bacterium]
MGCPQSSPGRNRDVVRITPLGGTPEELGIEHGRMLSGDINNFYTDFLRNAIFPFLNRERDGIAGLFEFYTDNPAYAGAKFGRQLLLDAAKLIVEDMPQEFKDELDGIAAGSGLPIEDVLILNTFFDALTSVLNVNGILSSLDTPRLTQVVFTEALLTDGIDNDEDGVIDEPGENVVPESRVPSPFALMKGVPVDSAVRFTITDTQLTDDCDVLSDDPENCPPLDLIRLLFGEGIDFDKSTVKVNDVQLARGDPGLSDNGLPGNEPPTPPTRAEFTVQPPEGWRDGTDNIVEFLVLDLAQDITPPPLHANDMRRDRVLFLTEGDPRSLMDVPNVLPGVRREDATFFTASVQDGATTDGKMRVIRHMQLLDNGVAFKFARAFIYNAMDANGAPYIPFLSLAWGGVGFVISGMSAAGLTVGVQWAETQDDGTIRGVLRAGDENVTVVPGAETGRVAVQGTGEVYICRPRKSDPRDFPDGDPIATGHECCPESLTDSDLCRLKSCVLGDEGAGGVRGCAGQAKIAPRGVPIGFTLRRVLQEATTLDEAIDMIKAQPPTAGWVIHLADGKARETAIVEIDAGNPLLATGFDAGRDVRVIRPGELPTTSASPDDLISCGIFNKNIPDSTAIGGFSQQNVWSPRWMRNQDTCGVLLREMRARHGTFDDAEAERLYRFPSLVSARSDMHGAIFLPESLDAYVILGRVPTTAGPFNFLSRERLGF